MATLSSETRAEVEAYLSGGGPFFGESRYEDVKTVKALGGKWNPTKKSWFAKDTEVLVALIQSQKWRPRSPARPKDIVVFVCEAERVEREAKHAAAAKVAAASAARPKPSAAQLESQLVQWLGIKKNSDAELQKLQTLHGLSVVEVDASARFLQLGPRSGLSNAARLLMGLERGILTANDAKRLAAEEKAEAKATPTAPKKRRVTVPIGPAPVCAPEDDFFDGSLAVEDKMSANHHLIHYPPPKWSVTRCRECFKIVSDQFLDCACHGTVWRSCETGAVRV